MATTLPDVAAIIDAATSEAKRRGHGEVTIAHCAIVVSRDNSREFDDVTVEIAERQLAELPQSFETPVESTALVDLKETVRGLRDPRDQFLEGVWVALVQPPKKSPKPGSTSQPQNNGKNEPSISDLVQRVASATIASAIDYLTERLDVVERLAAMFGATTPQPALIVGAPGVGKSTVAEMLAFYLSSEAYEGPLRDIPVIRIDTAKLLGFGDAERTAFTELFDVCRGKAILIYDDFEAFLESWQAKYLEPLRGHFGMSGAFFAFTVSEAGRGRLASERPEFTSRLETINLDPLPWPSVADILRRYALVAERTNNVTVPSPVISAAMSAPRQIDHRVQPGVGIRRLDRAVAAAASRPSRTAAVADLGVGGSGQQYVGFDSVGARERLSAHVFGQEDAIELVTRRLAVTRAGLDLRPERPDGVFLFAGPTGTGKTALALALAEEVFGSADALIRIDMSELNQDHTTSTLVGSPPGYVGSTEPDSWLVTKIRKRPQCVLLLDEIEKAHPVVWNTFLQVFDAGRLSDTLGNVADFRDVVVVMTTNLGASEFADSASPGFTDGGATTVNQRDNALEQIKMTMRPELLNRLDATLIFNPLLPEVVRSIAAKCLDDALGRAAARDWYVEYDESVIDYLVEHGYSKEYGARPIMRVIEHDVLNPIVGLAPGKWQLTVADGALVFQ